MKPVIVTLFLLFQSSFAFGNPITDGTFDSYKAGWFKSNGTSCASVCKRQEAIPEHERANLFNGEVRGTYLCKANLRPLQLKGEVYGNNYVNEKYSAYCTVALPGGKSAFLEDFSCLCVRR